MQRRLAAILSADVQGYSRLMGEDEAATVRTLTAYREVMGSLIREHGGRVVDTPGDNLLAEFPARRLLAMRRRHPERADSPQRAFAAPPPDGIPSPSRLRLPSPSRGFDGPALPGSPKTVTLIRPSSRPTTVGCPQARLPSLATPKGQPDTPHCALPRHVIGWNSYPLSVPRASRVYQASECR